MLTQPRYNNQPQSIISQVTLPNSPIHIWRWGPRYFPIEELEEINLYAGAGYIQVPRENKTYRYAYACLMSQCCDIAYIGNSAPSRLWARARDLEHVINIPVILCFELPGDLQVQLAPETTEIVMQQFLPPPQLGECALISEFGKPIQSNAFYSVSQLPTEAQALWRKINDALIALATPGNWMVWLEIMSLTLWDLERALTDLRSQELSTKGNAHRKANASAEVLETIIKNTRGIQQAELRRDWLERWREVQQIAKELASAYWEYHNQQREIAFIAPQQEQEQEQEPQEVPITTLQIAPALPIEKKPHKRRDAPIMLSESVLIRSDALTQGIGEGLLDGRDYITYPDRRLAEYKKSIAKNKGQILITFRPDEEEENWDKFVRSLDTLGDGARDTFSAVIIRAIHINGNEHITKPFFISPDDILTICQKEKSNGSYTPLQRATVIEHLKMFTHAHVQASIPAPYKRRGKPVEYRIESAVLDVLSGKFGAYETITGEEIWEKREVKIGNWATMVPEISNQTAIMLRKVLKYNAQKDRIAKRLGFYLTFMFRVNARHTEGIVHRRMATLLEQANIAPDLKNPGRTQEHIEKALAKLYKDKVIGKYGRVIDSEPGAQERQERIVQHANGWWHEYANQLWYFNPPDDTKSQYHQLIQSPEDKMDRPK